MLIDRIEDIKRQLYENKKVFVSDLSQQYDVSEVTIRKDLVSLQKQGLVKKFHGGAILLEKESINNSQKHFYSDKTRNALAELACSEIKDGDSIFLGSGRTCCVLASKLNRFKNLTVVTNNITALNDLLNMVYKVYLIGGEVTSIDENTLFSSMENPMKYFENIFVNKAFTSISGIDIKAGLTVNSIISSYIYKSIPEMTNSWYILANSEKFDKISMYPVSSLSQISCFICDRLEQPYKGYFSSQNINYKLL